MKTTAEEISKAQNALKQSGIVDNSNLYDPVFSGYISSFGASLVQAGLLPTIIFYENDKSDATDRPLTIKALKIMMGIDEATSMTAFIMEQSSNSNLRRCDDHSFLSSVVRNMTALKLALRMYKKKDNDYVQQ